MKYCVYDSGKPATLPLADPALGWSNNEFDSFEEAVKYVESWLGDYNNLPTNWDGSKLEYHESKCTIEIRSMEDTKEKNMETYDFGAGPVPAHHHSNGGGWVADTAYVSETAYVGPDALVYNNAQVYGNAAVCGNAEVCDNAQVYGNAKVFGTAKLYGHAEVYGNVGVYDNAEVSGYAHVRGDAEVSENARVYGHAEVCGDTKVCGNAKVWRFSNSENPELSGCHTSDGITTYKVDYSCMPFQENSCKGQESQCS